jgi:hypothetical protein
MWSLSIRGTLRYWPIEDEYKNNTAHLDRGPEAMPIQTIVLDIPDPLHACMSPNNQTLVIVCNSEWRVRGPYNIPNKHSQIRFGNLKNAPFFH